MIKQLKKRLKKLLKSIFNEHTVPKTNDKLPYIIEYPISNNSLKLVHVSAFNYGNAGDVLLPIVLQDTWQNEFGKIDWINQKVHATVDIDLINQINESDGVIIGGGGLFLRDTNPNQISGWQWPCSMEMLHKIKVPIIFYAVGYNRFRGQEEFEPFFKESITAFAEKSAYIGLRNYGSINAVKNYLPENLHSNCVFSRV